MAILSSPSRGDYEKIPILDGPDFGLQVRAQGRLLRAIGDAMYADHHEGVGGAAGDLRAASARREG
jgi:hypothetical protein